MSMSLDDSINCILWQRIDKGEDLIIHFALIDITHILRSPYSEGCISTALISDMGDQDNGMGSFFFKFVRLVDYNLGVFFKIVRAWKEFVSKPTGRIKCFNSCQAYHPNFYFIQLC